MFKLDKLSTKHAILHAINNYKFIKRHLWYFFLTKIQIQVIDLNLPNSESIIQQVEYNFI